MADTICIVGSHPDTRYLVPWQSKADIWVFNEAAQSDWCQRVNGVFQMHKPEIYRSAKNFMNVEHWTWLQQMHPYPIWMQAVDPDVPASIAYPLDAISRYLLPNLHNSRATEVRYFTSSVAMAVALAIYRQYQAIEVYGVEMSSSTEYTYQRDCYQFWLGVATGRGTDIHLHSGMDLFDVPLYGYDGEISLSVSYFEQRVIEHKQKRQRTEAKLNMVRHNLEHALEHDTFQEVAQLLLDITPAAALAGQALGAWEQAQKYAGYGDRAIYRNEFEICAGKARAEGEERRAQADHAGGKAEYVWNVWHQTKSPRAKEQLRLFAQEKATYAHDTGLCNGAYQENLEYMSELDRRLRAAGGQRALEITK